MPPSDATANVFSPLTFSSISIFQEHQPYGTRGEGEGGKGNEGSRQQGEKVMRGEGDEGRRQ